MPVVVQKAVTSFGQEEHVVPMLISSTPATLTSQNVYATRLILAPAAEGVSAIITIKDLQGTPTIVFQMNVDAGNFVSLDLGGRYCPGGITWESSVDNAVTGYLRWSR